jgi:medium-chain acyl-[acyl-carrier-protein] hydrolase
MFNLSNEFFREILGKSNDECIRIKNDILWLHFYHFQTINLLYTLHLIMNRIKLFCFPYAGGSAVIYNNWKQYLDPSIELRPIELSGRGKRIFEPLYSSVPDLIDDVYGIIMDDIQAAPYAFFGHSMGGMIGYELAQRIRKTKLPGPGHIFFSGRNAPHIKKNEKIIHLLPEDEFRKEIISLGGTPPDFFDYPELLEALLPVLRNDFKLADTDIQSGEILPLDCNITVFFGKNENLTAEQCEGWKIHTKKQYRIHYFEGGHFFLHDKVEQIVRFINSTLLTNVYNEVL